MPNARSQPTRRTHRTPQPQPQPPTWSAALLPSQRRAAERRADAEHRLAAQRWLRDLTRR
jgi:hypothetical protein